MPFRDRTRSTLPISCGLRASSCDRHGVVLTAFFIMNCCTARICNSPPRCIAKAPERLRYQGYYCRRLGLSLSAADDWGKFWDGIGFHETQDTYFLLARLTQLWRNVPRIKPVKVGVVLLGLVPAARHQPDLFADFWGARGN